MTNRRRRDRPTDVTGILLVLPYLPALLCGTVFGIYIPNLGSKHLVELSSDAEFALPRPRGFQLTLKVSMQLCKPSSSVACARNAPTTLRLARAKITASASGQSSSSAHSPMRASSQSRVQSPGRLGAVMAEHETAPLGPYCVLPRTVDESPRQHRRAPDDRGLPPEVEALMNFTDGPQPESSKNEGGILSWWRYQGLGL